jgi:hypothetical protein
MKCQYQIETHERDWKTASRIFKDCETVAKYYIPNGSGGWKRDYFLCTTHKKILERFYKRVNPDAKFVKIEDNAFVEKY